MTAIPWRDEHERTSFPGIPAWGIRVSRSFGALDRFGVVRMPQLTPQWAWGGSRGAGVRVCVLDSGVDLPERSADEHVEALAVVPGPDGRMVVEAHDGGDAIGHGTACVGIIQAAAEEASITSVRVLNDGISGTGPAMLAGLRWAIDDGFDVVNMSLSTTKHTYVTALRELADRAYFRRCLLVVAAHNMPVLSYPWTFSSVLSVACHDVESDEHFYNPVPPVDFYARGVRVTVPWLGGRRKVVTGNSFATPSITGLCARILAKHPSLTPFQLKTVLYLTSTNVRRMTGDDDAVE